MTVEQQAINSIEIELLKLSAEERSLFDSMVATHGAFDPDLRNYISLSKRIVSECQPNPSDPFSRTAHERLAEKQNRSSLEDWTRPIINARKSSPSAPQFPPVPHLR